MHRTTGKGDAAVKFKNQGAKEVSSPGRAGSVPRSTPSYKGKVCGEKKMPVDFLSKRPGDGGKRKTDTKKRRRLKFYLTTKDSTRIMST